MAVSYAWVVQGTRGSGKGAFGVHTLKDYLDKGLRVATNFNLYLENLPTSNPDAAVTRIPDMPNANHLYQLGKAYDFDENDPSTIDPSKNGLMLIDEISLFLSSKKLPEYEPLLAFFMLSRKMGWNLIFICQNKEQTQDVFFKSLCDKLVICKANGLQRIPYLGRILEFFGLSAMMPDNHTAFVLSGRSELDSVDKEIPYNWRPYRLAYNTYQLFTDQKEYLNGSLVDMRASYTFLPKSYITGEKFINQLNERLDTIKRSYSQKERGKAMAIKQSGMTTGAKIKIGLMIAGLAVYLYISNPLDNEFISKAVSSDDPSQVVQPQPLPAVQPNEVVIPSYIHEEYEQVKPDFIQQLFVQYQPVLTAMLQSNAMGVNAIIDFYQGEQIMQRLTTQEFHYHGYSVVPAGDTAVFVQTEGFKKRVTSDGVIRKEPQDNTEIASNLKESITLFSD